MTETYSRLMKFTQREVNFAPGVAAHFRLQGEAWVWDFVVNGLRLASSNERAPAQSFVKLRDAQHDAEAYFDSWLATALQKAVENSPADRVKVARVPRKG